MECLIVPPPGLETSRWLPTEHLASALAKCGIHPVRSTSHLGAHAAIIAVNHRPSRHFRQVLARAPKQRRILVVMEPEATGPSNYSAKTHAQYGKVFFASRQWAEKADGQAFPWPYPIREMRLHRNESLTQEFDTTMVFANKRSSSPQSLYRLRREVLRSASAAGVTVALFGPSWDNSAMGDLGAGARAMLRGVLARSRISVSEAFSDIGYSPSQWLGSIKDKREALQRALTTIAIENSRDFVSEKLFDPLTCGVVPVYVGPDLEDFGIPRSVALCAAPESRSILEVVRRASLSQLEETRAAGSEWIQSDAALEFDQARVMSMLGRQIGNHLS